MEIAFCAYEAWNGFVLGAPEGYIGFCRWSYRGDIFVCRWAGMWHSWSTSAGESFSHRTTFSITTRSSLTGMSAISNVHSTQCFSENANLLKITVYYSWLTQFSSSQDSLQWLVVLKPNFQRLKGIRCDNYCRSRISAIQLLLSSKMSIFSIWE